MRFYTFKYYKVISLYILSIYISAIVYADVTYQSNYTNTHEDDKFSKYEEEIRYLTNKVEILEAFVYKIMIHNNLEKEIEQWRQSFSEQKQISREHQAHAYDSTTQVVSNNSEYNAIIGKLKSALKLENIEKRDIELSEIQDLLEKFIKSSTNDTLISNAHFWLAETFFYRKIYDTAAEHYHTTYNLCKLKNNKGKAAASLLKFAISLGELKKHQEACDTISKLCHEFPNLPISMQKRVEDTKAKFGCSI